MSQKHPSRKIVKALEHMRDDRVNKLEALVKELGIINGITDMFSYNMAEDAMFNDVQIQSMLKSWKLDVDEFINNFLYHTEEWEYQEAS